jgi:hypothetical protein
MMAKAKSKKNDQTRLRIMFGILAVLAVVALYKNFGGGGGGGGSSSSVPTPTTAAVFAPLGTDTTVAGTTGDGTTDTTVATSDVFVEATRNPFDPEGGAAVLDESDD